MSMLAGIARRFPLLSAARAQDQSPTLRELVDKVDPVIGTGRNAIGDGGATPLGPCCRSS